MANVQLNMDDTMLNTFRGVPLTDIPNLFEQPLNLNDMRDIRDVDHTFMIKPFKYDSSNPDCEPEPVHGIDTYRDVWQDDYVRMPCSAGNITGRGMMDEGCVQEDIRFTISIEMLVSLLVCEKMQSNECIFLIGCEQFSTYTGYANTFKANGDYVDKTSKDSWGQKLCHVVAMDAIYYENPLTQYTVENMARELIKAYTCFRIPNSMQHLRFGIATGNWGCGAFNGDSKVKAIIQLIAASEANRPLIYATFRNQTLVESFWTVYSYLIDQQATVRHLCLYLQPYSSQYNKSTLFEFILTTPISTLTIN
ncbi:unnamed protein product [Adineta steineri]|uniref:PARG catalytic Macro domain-containing protein n=2 Tax=Adineta steineri TaxID=433720 RepID=A0A820AEV5_9BILA|nr:unnamed protein product [Adineta steineri]CAF4184133.1 unnamed protein product [Adineta steineri]